jgi:hypothetical protein
MTLKEELQSLGVKIRSKADSRIMCFIAFWLGPAFMKHYWTTISGKTIWAPVGTALDKPGFYETVIRHELVHIKQARKFPGLFQLSYLFPLIPIPIAYFRWLWERQAHLVNLKAGETIGSIVDRLWSGYAWLWPKGLMRRWFEKQKAQQANGESYDH